MNRDPRIAVVGLGYVGLPLAVGLAKHFEVTGFDIDSLRVHQLREGFDRTREVAESLMRTTTLKITDNSEELEGHDLFIVAVPTPVSSKGHPDLGALKQASLLVGSALKAGNIVVFESTVYPGVTEGFCSSYLEQASGLQAGKDFYLGYSPERINPGDHLHTVEKMVKVVAGQTDEVTALLAEVYGRVNGDQVFIAKNIATAEAAKVIENAQRDINIAFINEVTKIMSRLGLSMYEVLDAAETKWNFLKFKPGLVGGHCIGVDPYYLASCARKAGIEPEVVLAGRRTNESMGLFLAEMIKAKLQEGQKILVLGLTFKENIPDLRNTKVIEMVKSLQEKVEVLVHDPFADPHEVQQVYGFPLIETLGQEGPYDAIVGAVAHEPYLNFGIRDFQKLLIAGGTVFDIKGIWRTLNWTAYQNAMRYWVL